MNNEIFTIFKDYYKIASKRNIFEILLFSVILSILSLRTSFRFSNEIITNLITISSIFIGFLLSILLYTTSQKENLQEKIDNKNQQISILNTKIALLKEITIIISFCLTILSILLLLSLSFILKELLIKSICSISFDFWSKHLNVLFVIFFNVLVLSLLATFVYNLFIIIRRIHIVLKK